MGQGFGFLLVFFGVVIIIFSIFVPILEGDIWPRIGLGALIVGVIWIFMSKPPNIRVF